MQMMQGMMGAPRRLTQATSLLSAMPTRRLFSTPTMQLQYMVHTARVKVNLPQRGQCWFFIEPEDKVQAFVDNVKAEDDKLTSVEILAGADE